MPHPVPLAGCIPILCTPFADDGSLDLPSLEREVEWVLGEGASGVACLAIASEGYKLTEAERDAVARTVVAPHNAQGPISTATCVQLGACTPNLLVQELFDEFNVEWERELVQPPVEVSAGRIRIPERPGLGVELNWAEIEKHPYQIANFLPLFAPGWERREGERTPPPPAAAAVPAADETG